MGKENLEKKIVEIPTEIKKDVAKCLAKGLYYLELPDERIVCTYMKKELCPYSEKAKDREVYICKHWTERIGWRG